jgi:hypothetical protein
VDGATLTGLGLADRLALTWRRPRAGAALEIASADEARLVFYAVAGSALWTLGAVGAETLAPTAASAGRWADWVTTQVVVGLFFRPLALYAAAGLIGLACRAAGGRGGWRATRTATFWSGLAAEPPAVALALAGAMAAGPLGGAEGLAAAGKAAGGLLWALLLAPALAEAHGFRPARVFAALAALGVAVAVAAAAS